MLPFNVFRCWFQSKGHYRSHVLLAVSLFLALVHFSSHAYQRLRLHLVNISMFKWANERDPHTHTHKNNLHVLLFHPFESPLCVSSCAMALNNSLHCFRFSLDSVPYAERMLFSVNTFVTLTLSCSPLPPISFSFSHCSVTQFTVKFSHSSNNKLCGILHKLHSSLHPSPYTHICAQLHLHCHTRTLVLSFSYSVKMQILSGAHFHNGRTNISTSSFRFPK